MYYTTHHRDEQWRKGWAVSGRISGRFGSHSLDFRLFDWVLVDVDYKIGLLIRILQKDQTGVVNWIPVLFSSSFIFLKSSSINVESICKKNG